MSYSRIASLIKKVGQWCEGQADQSSAPAAGLKIYHFSGVTEPNYLKCHG